MSVSPEELQERTKQFALRIIKLYRALPKSGKARVLGNRVLRSGTSVAANYRAAGRARSRAEFAAKIGTAVEETDDTVFWLELIVDAGIMRRNRMENLLKEANELLVVFAASHGTARSQSQTTD